MKIFIEEARKDIKYNFFLTEWLVWRNDIYTTFRRGVKIFIEEGEKRY